MEELQNLVKLFVDKGESRPKLGPVNNGKLSKLIEEFGKEKFDELVGLYKASKETAESMAISNDPEIISIKESLNNSNSSESEITTYPIISTVEGSDKLNPRDLLLDAWGNIKDSEDKGRLHQYISSLKDNPDYSLDNVLARALKTVIDGDSRGEIKKIFRSVQN